GGRFQVLFHSPPGVLFTFPSRYSSTIGHQEVFSLTRWSWQIHGRFSEPTATRERSPPASAAFTYRTITVYGAASQRLRLTTNNRRTQCQPDAHERPTTPATQPLTGIHTQPV